jgi:hypothetical protein
MYDASFDKLGRVFAAPPAFRRPPSSLRPLRTVQKLHASYSELKLTDQAKVSTAGEF